VTIQFTELLSRVAELDGQTVEVSGRLAATLHEAYLIDMDTPFERWSEDRGRLECPRLTDLLLESVPARGGSELAYFDPAVVRGRVRRGADDASAATLNDLDLLVIDQAGIRHAVNLAVD
jgi:hypothetical protein